MNILPSKGNCRITFEEGEIYAGKILSLHGEYAPLINEFTFNRSDMYWIVEIERRTVVPCEVVESEKDKLIQYIKTKAEKIGINLLVWR